MGTIGPCDFGGTLPGGFAAHTKADRRAGGLHAIAYFGGGDHVQHVVVDATGRVSRTTDIALADRPMMHDFALTENYAILFDLPVTFSMDAVFAGREMPYTWNRRTIPRSVGPHRLETGRISGEALPGAVVAALGAWRVVGFGLIPALYDASSPWPAPGSDLAATLSASAVTPASRLAYWSRLAVEIQVSLPRSSLSPGGRAR